MKKRLFNTMLVSCIISIVLRGCFSSQEIFVSQSAGSKDMETCGNVTAPCRTLDHVFAKFPDSNVVSIDGGPNTTSPYVYFVMLSKKIWHSFLLRKWEYRDAQSPNPIVRRKETFLSTRLQCFAGSITIVSISFVSDLDIWVMYLCKYIVIINCSSESSGIIRIHKMRDQKLIFQPLNLYIRNSKVGILIQTVGEKASSLLFHESSPSFTIIFAKRRHILIYNSIVNNSMFFFRTTKFYISINNSTIENTLIKAKAVNMVLTNSVFKKGRVESTSYSVLVRNCVFDDNSVLLKGYQSKMLIHHTTFMNCYNPGKSALHIETRMLLLNITRCIFQNNTSFDKNIPSSLSMRSDIDAVHSEISHTDFYGSVESRTILSVRNKDVLFLNTSVICEDGQYVAKHIYQKSITGEITDRYFEATCQTCEKSTYVFSERTTLEKHVFDLNQMKNDQTRDNQSCISCPYNAVCEKGEILLMGGYWGYINTRKGYTKKTVSPIPCPAYYCCLSKELCTFPDTCAKHRTGRLCSQCQPGFSSDISAKYRCTRNSECRNAVVTFIVSAVSSALFILILLYLKEILFQLKHLFKCLTDKREKETDSDIDSHDEEQGQQLRERLLHESSVRGDQHQPTPYQIADSTADIKCENYRKTSNIVSGSLKIFFFFYQVAALVRIQSVDKVELLSPKFFNVISTFFNIQIDLSYSRVTLCVLPDLNTIQVKILRLGFIIITLALLLILWISTCVWHAVRNKKKPLPSHGGNTYGRIDDNVPIYTYLPFTVRVKCVYVQFLLIAYASIATFSFDAVHCVVINGGSYLYTQASIKCYQPWQYGMAAFIALWVVPFALSLYIGPKLLEKCYISPMQFLLMLSFPPTILCLLVKRRFQMSNQQQLNTKDAMLAKHMLLVVNEPFRTVSGESTSDGRTGKWTSGGQTGESTSGEQTGESNIVVQTCDDTRLCWEAVLILRRMLLVVTQIFIMSPIIKLYPMALLLLLYLSHHVTMKPFADDVLNVAEGYSLRVLLSLVFVNLFWAITRLVLSLPFIVLAFYMLYKAFRGLYSLFERIFKQRFVYKRN